MGLTSHGIYQECGCIALTGGFGVLRSRHALTPAVPHSKLFGTRGGPVSDVERAPHETYPWDSANDVPWTLLDQEGLRIAYDELVAPALRADGQAPRTDRPDHEWLSANGFRGLTYALREYHDTTFATWWDREFGADKDTFDWGIADEATIKASEDYLERRQRSREWSDGTVRTHRTRLAQYVRAHEAVATVAPIAAVDPEGTTPEADAIDACWDAFARLDERVTRRTLHRIYRTVRAWYAYLGQRRRATCNPTDGLDDHYAWDVDRDAANPSLAVEHVGALVDAATDPRDQLLMTALCAWGLRSGEVAALHVDQLVFEDPDAPGPYIQFEARKNGPGSVAMLYGADTARERVAALADRDDWTGYLFPSQRSESGHVTATTIRQWFDDLWIDAGLPAEIEGANPVPQMARRFWYDRYTATLQDLLEHVGEIAAEQGSASAQVVLRDYLSEQRRRELRREAMREKLAEAFNSGG